MKGSALLLMLMYFSGRNLLVLLHKTRMSKGCLTQDHLQLDMLSFDLHSLQAMMPVSDLSFMDVHMVCLYLCVVFAYFSVSFTGCVKMNKFPGSKLN